MREQITIYDTATRQPVEYRRIAFGTEPIVLAPGQDWYRGHVDATHYFGPDGEPVEKPEMDLAIAANQIAGIPVGASLIVNLARLPETVDDGEHTFEVDYPQIVHVVIEHPLFVTWIGEVACEP